jgi:hypothetical protein
LRPAPAGTRSASSRCSRSMIWVHVRTRSSRRLVSRYSTTAWSSRRPAAAAGRSGRRPRPRPRRRGRSCGRGRPTAPVARRRPAAARVAGRRRGRPRSPSTAAASARPTHVLEPTRKRQRFSWSNLPAPWNPTAADPGLLRPGHRRGSAGGLVGRRVQRVGPHPVPPPRRSCPALVGPAPLAHGSLRLRLADQLMGRTRPTSRPRRTAARPVQGATAAAQPRHHTLNDRETHQDGWPQ